MESKYTDYVQLYVMVAKWIMQTSSGGKHPILIHVGESGFQLLWYTLDNVPQIWVDPDPDIGITEGFFYKPMMAYVRSYAEEGIDNLLFLGAAVCV